MRSYRFIWTSLLTIAAFFIAMAGSAAAAPFTVDSTADTGDAALNGTCDDGTGQCTLRAAMQEANNTAAADTISFDSTTFNGTTGATITVATALPTLIHPASISSSGCIGGGLPKPCVAVKGDGTFDGITMGSGSSGSTVAGVDLFKLRTAVVDSDGGGTIQGNWFGIDLAGSPTSNANTNGVQVLSNSGTIGGATAATRNVFANDTASGISIEGGDSNTVTGNYFGTTPAGALDANLSNHDSIAVATVSAGSNTAFGNTIGGSDTNSNTACDGACNLLGNTVDDEIELSGTSVSGGSPAISTTIKGNYVGLQLNGTDGSTASDFTSGSAAVEMYLASVSNVAAGTVIGGPNTTDRNYIGGNRTGIDTGQPASGQAATIENNYIGVQPDGTGSVPNQFTNIAAAGSNTSAGVLIKDNLIGSNGSANNASGIILYGANTVVQGNVLGVDTAGASLPFGAAAIATGQGNGAHANLIGGTLPGDGNVIAGGVTNAFFGSGGVSIAGDSANNTIEGNFIGTDSSGTANYGNTGPGIEVNVSTPGGGSSRTRIGSDSPAAPNLISNNTGPAIAVHQMRDVEIQSNLGSGNGGLFIDLENPVGVGNGPGPGTNVGDGSANGLQAPTIGTPTTTSVTGTSVAGATIRVFAKSSASLDGELGALIGTGTADGGGSWAVTFTSTQPELQQMVATQTRTGSITPETSEESSVVQVPDTTPPITTIDSKPPLLTNNPTPTLTFHANETATFTCQFDGGAPVLCTSPASFGPLADGTHTIVVTATDSALNAETSPPSATFKVDTTAPTVSVTATRPKIKTKRKTAAAGFTFSSPDPTATLECGLDGAGFAPCSSPFSATVRRGSHTLQVRARDAAGNQGQPQSATVRVVKKKKK